MSITTEQLKDRWAGIRRVLTIRNEREYDRAVKRLNALLDEVGADHTHPLYDLLDTLGTLIHAYEEQHFRVREPAGPERREVMR